MLSKKIFVVYLLLAALFGGLISIAALKFTESTAIAAVTLPISVSEGEGAFTVSRLEGYQYIQPVLMVEPNTESRNLLAVKSDVSNFIENMINTRELDYASVYLKDLNTNEWMECNPTNEYHPGSLTKVITMITFLRMAETNLSILEKEVVYNGLTPPSQTFNSKTIVPGNKYKIKDLIYYMVVYSDNHATMLLHNYVDVAVFEKVFADLNLGKPDIRSNTFQLSAKEYSRLINVLYDGGYLTITASEFAISLLCESDFNLGMTRELPKNTKIAHKFGEAGTSGNRELHECGIVYLNNKPYLLTIMTKGKDSKQLVEIISHISKIVFEHMKAIPA